MQYDLSKPVILYKANAFWRAEVHDNLVTTFRGQGQGNVGGRPYTKHFASSDDANAWAMDAITNKQCDGYQQQQQQQQFSNSSTSTTTPEPRRSSRKRAPPVPFVPGSSSSQQIQKSNNKNNVDNNDDDVTKSQSPQKRIKKGLRGNAPVDTSCSLGVIDRASGLSGKILTRHDGIGGRSGKLIVYDAMLVLLDISKNHDKFIVLQLIDSNEGKNSKYTLYERWGRTGTAGNSLTMEYNHKQLDVALKQFESKFLQKTGVEWSRAHSDAPVAGKYRFVKQDFTKKSVNPSAMWQYWVDDGVDGKEIGWYDYDDDGNALVEQLYLEFQSNQTWLAQRIVKSGVFSYLVDLHMMTQMNVIHPNHTVRRIQRVGNNCNINNNNNNNITVGAVVIGGNVSGATQTKAEPTTAKQETNIIATTQVKAKEEPQDVTSSTTGTSTTTKLVKGSTAATTKTGPSSASGSAIKLKTIAKKPNVAKPNVKPAHKVEAVPVAHVASRTKGKGKGKVGKEKNEIVKTEDTEEEIEIEIDVDKACPSASNYKVVGDWDATMNQTNIMDNNNNNKYYRLQLLQTQRGDTWYVWTRWGRVGEVRGVQTKLMGPFKEMTQAERAFSKKFRDKTGFHWIERFTHEPVQGKYEVLKIDHSASAKTDDKELDERGSVVTYAESELDNETQDLVELLFEEKMYQDALKEFDIDVRRMPLGKLSTEQIEKGVDVLKLIQQKIGSAASVQPSKELEQLSSKFYTVLPHDFGRRKPPVICDSDHLQQCFDKCNVLRDMEKACKMMNAASETEKVKSKEKKRAKVDTQYGLLKSDLRLLKEDSDEMKIVRNAFETTKGSGYGVGRGVQLLHAWRVERHGEADRFHKSGLHTLDNHQLLWHGTNIACIPAILSTGLRIMPHSGGRVGKGIYLATENNKSLGYTCPAPSRGIGCMFLAEAALGKQFEIEQDRPDLVRAPEGFDSVRACGRSTPPVSKLLMLDNLSVSVPASKPVLQPKRQRSSFYQDEVLVYREEQIRMRYVVSVKFG